MDVELEWDNDKRQWTLRERGLDFADVAKLDWDKAITRQDVRQPYPETRFITYGRLETRLETRLCVMA